MQESAGKKIARAVLYEEFLPSCLSPEQLRSGNLLVLFGDPPRELPYIDQLLIPRDHVWSVEHIWKIYRKQLDQDLGTWLHLGELKNFLESFLHQNHAFSVLNLDIEGSYLKHLDSAMDLVLLFCWRNPTTVVATYSSIGRDTRMIWEGIKSLAVFLWLAEDLTRKLFANFCGRYCAAGYKNSERLVLRDLFWLRSHLEQTAIASAMVGLTSVNAVSRFFEAEEAVWQAVVKSGRSPLRFSTIAEAVRSGVQERGLGRSGKTPRLGVSFEVLLHILYRANSPWSQRCYFTQYQSIPLGLEVREAVSVAVEQFLDSPLVFIDRDGTRVDISHQSASALSSAAVDRIVLWPRRDIYSRFRPRKLTVRAKAPHLIEMSKTIRSLRGRIQNSESKASDSGKEASMPGIVFVRNGQLTNAGAARLSELAGQGLTTEEIQDLVPNTVLKSAIVARVAVANRKYDGKQFMRGGKLTKFGLAEVRRLAAGGKNTKEIQGQVPSTVPARLITPHVAVAHRK